jgi:hypothetical protein
LQAIAVAILARLRGLYLPGCQLAHRAPSTNPSTNQTEILADKRGHVKTMKKEK